MRVYGQRAGRLGIAIAVVCLPLCGAWCSYGHAPGRWIERDDRLEWQLFNPRCQLRRFVDEFATDRARQPVSILLIGDSTDRLLHENLCQHELRAEEQDNERGNFVLHGGGTGHESPDSGTPYFNCDSCSACVIGERGAVANGTDPLADKGLRRLTVGHMYVWGVAPSGPYYWGNERNAIDRADEAIAAFRNFTGGDPDVVAFASGFWDLGRFHNIAPAILQKDEFEESVLQEWQTNLADVFRHLRVVLPKTIGIFRTQAHPMPLDCNTGDDLKQDLGRKAHIVQLNAAGRYVASEHHWHTVDVEPMIAKFAHPRKYLADGVHQQEFLSLEIMNIYLNILNDAQLFSS